MRELDDVLAGTLDQGTRAMAGEQLDADTVAVLRGRISARRARRRVLQGIAATPVVAALAVGGWLLSGRMTAPAPEATQPGPTEPAPTEPAPTPTSTGQAATPLPTEPGLPERLTLPDGLLEQTTPGWVLAVYQPETAEQAPGTAVVTLTSPQGETYEVLRLDGSSDAGGSTGFTVLDWEAGSGHALIAESTITGRDGGRTEEIDAVLELDLVTGTTTATGVDPAGLSSLRTAGELLVWSDWDADETVIDGPDGRLRVPGASNGLPELSPDGRRLLLDASVVDLASGTRGGALDTLVPGADCWPLNWWTTTEVLLACTDPDPTGGERPYVELEPRLVAADVTAPQAGAVREVLRIEVGDPVIMSSGARVADGVLVADGTTLNADTTLLGDLCADSAYVVTEGGIAPIGTTDRRDGLTAFLARAVDGQVVVESTDACVGAGAASTLDAVDVATGEVRTLLPLPADDVGAGGGTRWTSGPASWVLGR